MATAVRDADVDVVDDVESGIDLVALAAIVAAVATREGVDDGEVSVQLVDDERMRTLNRDHRGTDATTDVLSFPIDEDETDVLPGVPRLLGDVVICPAQAARQAADAGVPRSRELAELAIHGTLHLLGHDHERDAGAMLARQDALLAELGAVPWR